MQDRSRRLDDVLDAGLSAAGFAAWGVLAPVPGRLDPTGFDAMVADGLGDLAWIADTREQRLAPATFGPAQFPDGPRAVVVAWMPYQAEAGDGDGADRLRRARYAAGKDYHVLLREALARVGRGLTAADGTPYAQRAAVDSAPVNERTLARLAGVGWVGRNALVIAPTLGTYGFLGTLFTAAPLSPRSAGHDGADRCGRCRACEVRCPTAALVGRRCLSTRCISYLTIEHQGVIPRDLAAKFEGWWFGCDLCQEVCPWNRFAPRAGDARLIGRADDDREARLVAVTAEDFDRHFAGRAVRRIGWVRFRRNLLVALWSLGRVAEATSIARADAGLPLVADQARELGLGLA